MRAWVAQQYRHVAMCARMVGCVKIAAKREAQRGLWANPQPVPPWEWRKEK